MMDDFIRTTLYHRSQDSQGGVLLSVFNSLEQHEHRECLLHYLLLLVSHAGAKELGGAATELGEAATGAASVAEVGQLCKDFLEEEFGLSTRLKSKEVRRRALESASAKPQSERASGLARSS